MTPGKHNVELRLASLIRASLDDLMLTVKEMGIAL